MISNYTELQSEVNAWSHRSDLTAKVPTFISLVEADLQVRCKLVDFEGSATLTVTAGVATLPTDFSGMRSIYWDGDQNRPLRYITPDRYDADANRSGTAYYYTITGSTLKTSPPGDGQVVMTYKARLVPLSDSDPTNAILTRYPDAYLQGALYQAGIYTKNTEAIATHGTLFNDAVARIISDDKQRKYAGPLEVRAR